MSIESKITSLTLTNEEDCRLEIRINEDNDEWLEIVTDGFAFDKSDASEVILAIANMCGIDLEIS